MDKRPDAIDAPSQLEPPCEECGVGRGIPYRVTLSKANVHIDVRCSHCRREWYIANPRADG